MAKAKTTPTKIPAAIGSVVYIRDNDDRTIQLKARVYDMDFSSQTAAVGFYPDRDGPNPSMLHLPQMYRATVPISELSLTPHEGTQQVGYIDALIMAGVATEADSSFGWTDEAGGTHQYGANAIVAPASAEAPVPEFDVEEPEELPPAPAAPPTATQMIMEEVNKQVAAAYAREGDQRSGHSVPVNPQAPLAGLSTAHVLFTRNEILTKIAEAETSLAQLRRMVEAVVKA